MRRTPGRESRILVLAPVGRDAAIACEVLQRQEIEAEPCATIEDLAVRVTEGAGAAVIAEEALSAEGIERIAAALDAQEPWSDLPIVILSGSERAAVSPRPLRLGGVERLGNVTVLERPFRIHELVTLVRSALRARRRQYEVRDLLDELAHGVRARDEFLAMLGHELRNPLGAMLYAQQILARAPSPALATKQQAVLDRQIRHLTRLVDDLLDVSRVTTGKIVLQKVRFDVRESVERAVESARSSHAQGHEVRVDLDPKPLVIAGDVVRVDQILANLLTNAFKYTPGTGHVWVSARREGGHAVIRVRDDGAGIAPEMLPRMFDLFAQAAGTLDRARGGMGIGLTLVRSLVHLHGGDVAADSPGLGKGAEFRVSFPIVAEKLVAAGGTAPAKSIERLRILVVEDNDDIRESLCTLLSPDHEVIVARTGLDAVERVTAAPPDVALVDIGLPGLDGYGVARALRARLRNVTLVALTGYGQPEDQERALSAGFDHHLTKPVSIDSVFEILARATAR